MHVVQRTATQITVNGMALLTGRSRRSGPANGALSVRLNSFRLAHENSESLSKIFTKSYNTSLVSSHDNNLSALRLGIVEKLLDLVRDLGRSVFNSVRSCGRLV